MTQEERAKRKENLYGSAMAMDELEENMTQEEKQLLLKDLCARLPYGVKIYVKGHDVAQVIEGILHLSPNVSFRTEDCYSVYLTDIKPYLRPLSSMTEEEENEWWKFADKNTIVETHSYSIDWLNAHHFDYRGLIPMGLALPAPEGMY